MLNRSIKRILLCLIIGFLGFSGTIIGQTEYYVRLSGSGSGTSFSDAFGDLEQALSVATAGDKIYVATGTYKPSQQYNSNTGATSTANVRLRTFKIPDGVEVYGSFSGAESGTIDQSVLDGRNFTANETILSGDFNDDDVISGSGATLSITGNSENVLHVILTIGVS
ncbi:MAG: hypothetical protein AAF740_06050, partial [Bacteroidota bacterium]